MTFPGLQKLGARMSVHYGAPKLSIRYTKKRAPKIKDNHIINNHMLQIK